MGSTLELRPDILLLDLVMPGLRPFEVEKWVRTNYPETTTLILTAHDRDCFLTKAVEAGAAGFLTKEESPQGLVEAIHRAAGGEILVTGEQLDRVERWCQKTSKYWESLTNGGCQGRCRLKAFQAASTTSALSDVSGLSHTSFAGAQFRIPRDQRPGRLRRALSYTVRRRARMAWSSPRWRWSGVT